MIKLIVGSRGSGKTKKLLEQINDAAKTSAGNVVCLDKTLKLRYDVDSNVRLVDMDAYGICGFDIFYGFILGLMAGNYDITHLFVDGTFKIGKVGDVEKDYEGFAAMIQKLAKVQSDAQIIFTVSCDEADLPVTVKDYIVK